MFEMAEREAKESEMMTNELLEGAAESCFKLLVKGTSKNERRWI